jgi:hypothetical protein
MGYRMVLYIVHIERVMSVPVVGSCVQMSLVLLIVLNVPKQFICVQIMGVRFMFLNLFFSSYFSHTGYTDALAFFSLSYAC